jgi:hypothetical protein
MIALRTPWLTRMIIYAGVRIGGQHAYKGGC